MANVNYSNKMIQENLEWNSVNGLKLFASTWKPDNNVKAVVCLVHGFGEHCLRYTPYIEYFTKNDIAFIAYDHMGHGSSEGKRGVISSYNDLLKDVQLCVDKAAELFPNVPQFIYGHSMGGNIALNYLIEMQPQIKGAIITSPWLTLTNNPGFLAKAAVSFIKLFFPNITVDSGLEIDYISTVREEVEKYRNDKKNHGRISFRLFHHITKNGLRAMVNIGKLSIPTLLMHGSNDKITSPIASSLIAKGNNKMIKYVEWPNCYHELHNEANRSDVSSTVLEWINSQL